MYHINFSQPVNIHFIGIGGISMSGLAQMLHARNFHVSGSDAKQSSMTSQLESLGISIVYGQSAANITDKIACVVYTAAVKPGNPEYDEAVRKKIPLLNRAELLGQIMAYYKNAINISGTHGKTTVTSMVSLILLEAGFDPSINLGGILDNIGSNMRIGNSDFFVVEACEYTNSFLNFHPKHEIILNIEADHLDFFKDIKEIHASFREFAEKVPEDGYLIINSSIQDYTSLIRDLPCHVVTYGLLPSEPPAPAVLPNFYGSDITFDENGFGEFNLYQNQTMLMHIQLSVPGGHNVSNAVSAAALCICLGIPALHIQNALLAYHGTKRRFEKKGMIGGVTIIDDYAHHPTEITAALTAARQCPHNKIWCVFQPHTFSRTKAFLKEFARALSNADYVILPDIYPAREENIYGISSKDLLRELEILGIPTVYQPSFDQIENFLLENCTNGDLLITMGAGDVNMIGDSLLGR